MKLKWIISVFAVLSWFHSSAHDTLKNRPEYSLPLSDTKRVIAHCMTNIIRYKGHEMEDSCKPEYYFPKGNITSSLGGLSQVYVTSDVSLKEKSLDEAVEFEMKAAKQSGIDGFQFYYILGNRHGDEIIKAYFRVAEKKKIDFKFALCISHPAGRTESQKITEFAERINGIMTEVGKDNPHWLRTPDGRLITYMWYGEQLADVPAKRNGLPPQYYYARAFSRLGKAINENLACVFTINERLSTGELNAWLDYFPATWIWTLSYKQDYFGKLVSKQCKIRSRNFTGSAFCDFYTSKLLRPGTWNMFHRAQDAVKAGITQVERKYIATGLSYNFRKLLEFGIEEDVRIMNIITWNDYPEGHHLAPEANHNYGFSVLLNYYKDLWKGTPYKGKDIAIAFFKKYKSSVKPAPFYIPVVEFEKEAIPFPVEDSIEVVTILTSPASVTVNGKSIQVNQGLVSSVFESQTGQVEVSLSRNSRKVLHFITPEGITDWPYRTDRLTYSYSSEYQEFHRNLFGDLQPVYVPEYVSETPKSSRY